MVQIRECGPNVAEADIARLESRTGALPLEYRQFLLKCNGGRPNPDVIDVTGLPGSEVDVKLLYGVARSSEVHCIEWNMDTLAGRLDAGLVPIASDSCGSVFCLSLRMEDMGAVLYCDLQSVFGMEGAPALYPVASSFSAFFEQLRPCSE